MPNKKNHYVSSPFLPPLDELYSDLEKIWKSKQLTNNGSYLQKLENEISEYLKAPNVSLVANGTMALIAALKCLNLHGNAITTPLTFVATTHAISLAGLTPHFVDVSPKSGNIDADEIEKSITKNTSVIVPVNIYGNPCDMEKINLIANKHDVKVVCDAAQSFGVTMGGQSILNDADYTTLSLHATKIFHTIEGGVVIAKTPELKRKIDLFRNFGIENEYIVSDIGLNAKMNEIQALIGLKQLPYIESSIKKCEAHYKLYTDLLSSTKGVSVYMPDVHINWNYCYMPIFVNNEKYGKTRDELHDYLRLNGIVVKKYFHPLISEIPIYANNEKSSKKRLPHASQIGDTVICLPIYVDLEPKEILEICDLIQHFSMST